LAREKQVRAVRFLPWFHLEPDTSEQEVVMVVRDSTDRVREHTAEQVNEGLDRALSERVQAYAGRSEEEITQRIAQLEREWDIERILEMNASALAFTGVTLGAFHDRRWLVLPSLVLPFLFQHAVQGWCPPVPLFRRLGVRTRKEIERERYALKALRGDFSDTTAAGSGSKSSKALEAVGR
jgi:PAS domain-containing protein